MVGDWPISGDRIDDKVYSDINDDIFEVEKTFPDSLSPVRKVDQLVVELGEKEGVDTYIVPPPLIFGPGTGSFTLGFGQVHMVAQMAIKRQQSVMIGAGSGVGQFLRQYTCTCALCTNNPFRSGTEFILAI
jgi:hypothetical protein